MACWVCMADSGEKGQDGEKGSYLQMPILPAASFAAGETEPCCRCRDCVGIFSKSFASSAMACHR